MPFGQGRSGGGGGGRGRNADKKPGDKEKGQRRTLFRRRKVCKFWADKIDDINYKDVKLIGPFVPERAKILPRRISGSRAKHQRTLQTPITRARQTALIACVTEEAPGSESARTRRPSRTPRRPRERRRRLRAQLSAAAQNGSARHRGQQEGDRAREGKIRRRRG